MPFSEMPGCIALFPEHPCQCNFLCREVSHIGRPNPVPIIMPTSETGAAGWRTNGSSCIKVGQLDPAVRHSVKMRGADNRVPVESSIPVPKVVSHHQDYVW